MNALRQLGLGLGELEVAEANGIVTLDGDRLAFRHPLMRSAAYHEPPGRPAATPTGPWPTRCRRIVGAGLAPGPRRGRARRGRRQGARRGGRGHRPARRTGRARPARGSWPAGCRRSPADRVRRLRLAADAILDAGMASAAGRLLERADAVVVEYPEADDLIERIRRQQLRCRLPPSSGGPASRRSASAAPPARWPARPGVAVDLLFDALAAYFRDGAFADMASTIDEAMALRERVDERGARRIDVMDGALLIAQRRAGRRGAARPVHGDDRAGPLGGRCPVPGRGAGPVARLPAPHGGRPTRCSPTSTPTCGPVARCGR